MMTFSDPLLRSPGAGSQHSRRSQARQEFILNYSVVVHDEGPDDIDRGLLFSRWIATTRGRRSSASVPATLPDKGDAPVAEMADRGIVKVIDWLTCLGLIRRPTLRKV